MKILGKIMLVFAKRSSKMFGRFSDFEYSSALNIPGLWICQGSEYASGSEYVRVLDIPGF